MPRSFTSVKGRLFGLSYAKKAASLTGLVQWIEFQAGLDRSQTYFLTFSKAEEGQGLHNRQVLTRRSRRDYWRRSICTNIMGTHVKSTRGVLLREDRGLTCVSDVRAGRLARFASKMHRFTRKLGTLGDLHLPRNIYKRNIYRYIRI